MTNSPEVHVTGDVDEFLAAAGDHVASHATTNTVMLTSLARVQAGRPFSSVTLFADAANGTSNRIYQRLGFVMIGEVVEIVFVPATAGSA